MKMVKTVLQVVFVTLFAVLGCAMAEKGQKPSCADNSEKIAYHKRMEKQLSVVNRFLSIKHPLSSGNPEFHAKKAAELKKSL